MYLYKYLSKIPQVISHTIVLDEATAFADPENERNIQKALESLMKDKTVIIIAHRLSTVRGADKIVVIDEGRVAKADAGVGMECSAMT